MKDEVKIVTIGDIFENLQTEEKALKFLAYIICLQRLQEAKDSLQNDYQEAVDKINELQEENKRLRKERDKNLDNVMFLSKVADEKQQTIDKAIEYINTLREDYFNRCVVNSNKDLGKIIDILQGSDKE